MTPSRSEAHLRITGSMLRDLVVCERRPWHDIHTDAAERDAVSTFVQLLWADGVAHEGAIVAALSGRTVDLRRKPEERLDHATAAGCCPSNANPSLHDAARLLSASA